MSFVDREVLQELVLESKEHLEQIEPDLLAIEEDIENASSDLVHGIFRAIHSIKGGFGFFGMRCIEKLSHVMENVLMRVRDGELDMSSDMVDSLLAGVDKLHVMLDDVENSDSIEIDTEVGSLIRFLGQEGPEAQGASEAQDDAPAEDARQPREEVACSIEEQIRRALEKGQKIYSLCVLSHSDLQDQGRSPLSFITKLAEIGDVLDVSLDTNAITDLKSSLSRDISYRLLIASSESYKEVSKASSLPAARIAMLDEQLLLKMHNIQITRPAPEPALESAEEEDQGEDPVTERSAETSGEEDLAAPEAMGRPETAAGSSKASPQNGSKPRSQHSSSRDSSSEAVRVRVNLLDNLMNLAGELVLGRNQMLQYLNQRFAECSTGDRLKKSYDTAITAARNSTISLIQDDLRMSTRATTDGEMLLAIRSRVDKVFEKLSSTMEETLSMRISDDSRLRAVLAHLDRVTSDLQENIMNTRMQPVGSVFGKFPRLARDLSKKLNKDIRLQLCGEDVELDKSIIEALSDPLTHLVRNCADHAIEYPHEREAAGKPRAGNVVLSAYHDGGQVNIEICDDGRGIDVRAVKRRAIERGIITDEQARSMSDREAYELIFAPGFSTAQKVSEVSGRGVGMDVVRTNVASLGGTVTVDSRPGDGTTIRLSLPLTLAIVPSLIATVGGRRFAVPQLSIEELVRIRMGDLDRRIETIQGADVLRLREKLLPLVRLANVLAIRPEEGDPEAASADSQGGQDDACTVGHQAVHILVLKVGTSRFGLIVDQVVDIEEIVVKPLSGYLKDRKCYAGSTIMGDGKVAMILDASGIAETAGLRFEDIEKEMALDQNALSQKRNTESQSLLIFKNHPDETFAINLDLVSRIEKIAIDDIEVVGSQEYIKDNGKSLKLVRLEHYLPVNSPMEEQQHLYVIVPKHVKHPLGIVATTVDDAVMGCFDLDRTNLRGTGILGSTLLDDRLVIIVDVYGLLEAAEPELYGGHFAMEGRDLNGMRILFAEDTAFFRGVVSQYLEAFGCSLEIACDGEDAWTLLNSAKHEFDAIVTDIEMPAMDGLELTRRVRASEKLEHLPVIALTSLDPKQVKELSKEAGVDQFLSKLDRDSLRSALAKATH